MLFAFQCSAVASPSSRILWYVHTFTALILLVHFGDHEMTEIQKVFPLQTTRLEMSETALYLQTELRNSST